MAAARRSQLRTLCLHPDGTGSYGRAEVGDLKGRVQVLTAQEAAELMENAEPISAVLPDKVLEDAVLEHMGGMLAEHSGTFITDFATRPEDVARLLDGLHNLPETSPLAAFYDTDDSTFRGLQELVMDLLDAEEALGEALGDAVYGDHRTIFTPADLQALIDATRPDRFATDEDDEEPV